MMHVAKGVGRAEIRAVVTRADGTVEDYGRVSFYSKSKLDMFFWRMERLLWRVKRWLHLS